jgi:hypothetical protein
LLAADSTRAYVRGVTDVSDVPDVPGDVREQDAKTWLAGVFDRAAPTYDRVGDAYHDFFGERLVDVAEVREGTTLLDVACGRGAALLPSAEDEHWAWEDEVLSTLESDRRAIVRPFDTASEVESLLRSAGFDDISCQSAQHDVRFADEETWWAWKWSYSLRGVLEQQDESALDGLRRAASERMQPYLTADGLPCRLTANLVRGRRPVGSTSV